MNRVKLRWNSYALELRYFIYRITDWLAGMVPWMQDCFVMVGNRNNLAQCRTNTHQWTMFCCDSDRFRIH